MERLIRILVEDVLRFAYCDEKEISEDFAVAQLERIAQSLNCSDNNLIQRFIGVVQSMGKEARAAGKLDRATQLESMPSHLGLE